MPPLDDKQQYSLNALLYDAVLSANLDRVKLCLSRGAQAGKAEMDAYFRARGEETVPLAHLALKNYNKNVLDALAKDGLLVDDKDREGYTALARATMAQRPDPIGHLITLGASPLEATNAGKTVLDLARANEGYYKESIIDTLLKGVPLPGAFSDAAKKPEAPVATTETITVSKPISLNAPHKKSGFEL
jgi:hypothetical protein